MVPYWIFFVFSSLFCFLDFITIKREDRFLLFVIQIVVMTFFSGLRYNSDFDYMPYAEIYNLSPTIVEWYELFGTNIPAQTYGEPIFVIVCILFKSLSLPVTSLMVFIAAMTFFFLARFTWKFSHYPFSSVFLYNGLYFLAGGFTQIRFGLATVVVLNALWSLYNNNLKEYIVLILLAAGFHVTALIGLLIVPFYFIKLHPFYFLFIGFVGLIISFLDLNSLLIEYFFNVESESSYKSYLSESNYLSKASNTLLIVYFFVLLAFVFLRNQIVGLSKQKINLLIAVAAISLLVGGFTIQVNILSRFTVLLQIVYIFIIPYLFYIFRYKHLALAVMLGYAIFKYNQFLSPDGFILPYQNVLFV